MSTSVTATAVDIKKNETGSEAATNYHISIHCTGAWRYFSSCLFFFGVRQHKTRWFKWWIKIYTTVMCALRVFPSFEHFTVFKNYASSEMLYDHKFWHHFSFKCLQNSSTAILLLLFVSIVDISYIHFALFGNTLWHNFSLGIVLNLFDWRLWLSFL